MLKAEEIKERYGSTDSQYDSLNNTKSSSDTMWEECAELTLPYIYPSNTPDTAGTMFPTPFNSLGPTAVNALSAKLLLALLPPSGPFFRFLPKDVITAQEDMGEEELAQLDKALSKLEHDVIEEISIQGIRVPLFEALKLLVVTGNTLLYKVKGKGFKVFSPHQYVVKRDFVGSLTELIIKETMSYVSLPKKVQDQVKDDIQVDNVTKDINLTPVDVYTRITKSGTESFTGWQEINDTILDNSIKHYTTDTLPYLPLRWNTVNNEDYGRGLVEQYIGDLRSLEGLTQTIVEGSGIAAQFIFGLRPNSTLNLEDLNNAQNGEFVLGDLEREVSVLQVNKGADLQVPMALIQEITARLSKAFLMLHGNIRDSERTTAVEVRATVGELEATLGGVYTVLAAELQKPLLNLIIQEMEPNVLKITDITITTGVSAISREKDFQNLNTMVQVVSQFGPEVAQQYLNMGEYFSEVATALGMDAEALVKSEEQIQAERQQQMQQQMAMEQQQMQMQQQAQMQQQTQG